MMRAWFVGVLFAGALVAIGCGGAPGLPDQGACPTPAAALTDDTSPDAYRAAVLAGIELIQGTDQQFRVDWDDRKLRERSEFRADFAVYAHQTECELRVMEGLAAPTEGPLAEFGSGLRPLLAEYLIAIDAGRTAVQKRNASAYDDWIKQIDTLAVALGDRHDQLIVLH